MRDSCPEDPYNVRRQHINARIEDPSIGTGHMYAIKKANTTEQRGSLENL